MFPEANRLYYQGHWQKKINKHTKIKHFSIIVIYRYIQSSFMDKRLIEETREGWDAVCGLVGDGEG